MNNKLSPITKDGSEQELTALFQEAFETRGVSFQSTLARAKVQRQRQRLVLSLAALLAVVGVASLLSYSVWSTTGEAPKREPLQAVKLKETPDKPAASLAPPVKTSQVTVVYTNVLYRAVSDLLNPPNIQNYHVGCLYLDFDGEAGADVCVRMLRDRTWEYAASKEANSGHYGEILARGSITERGVLDGFPVDKVKEARSLWTRGDVLVYLDGVEVSTVVPDFKPDDPLPATMIKVEYTKPLRSPLLARVDTSPIGWLYLRFLNGEEACIYFGHDGSWRYAKSKPEQPGFFSETIAEGKVSESGVLEGFPLEVLKDARLWSAGAVLVFVNSWEVSKVAPE